MELFFSLVVIMVSFYTFTYVVWLWRQKKKKSAWGLFSLILFTLLYSLLLVFFLDIRGV